MADRSAPTYRQLLEEAREIGRADGRFAAAFEPPGTGADHQRATAWGARPPSSPGCSGTTDRVRRPPAWR